MLCDSEPGKPRKDWKLEKRTRSQKDKNEFRCIESGVFAW